MNPSLKHHSRMNKLEKNGRRSSEAEILRITSYQFSPAPNIDDITIPDPRIHRLAHLILLLSTWCMHFPRPLGFPTLYLSRSVNAPTSSSGPVSSTGIGTYQNRRNHFVTTIARSMSSTATFPPPQLKAAAEEVAALLKERKESICV